MGSWRPDPLKTLGRALTGILLVAVLQACEAVTTSVDSPQDELGQRLKAEREFSDLVVRVLPQRRDGNAAASGQGFGIIVARRGQDLIIATPRHVVFDDAYTDAPNVRFRASPNTDMPARRFPNASEPDDLAWLTVRAPPGMQIRTAPVVSPDRLTNRWAWAVGDGETWAMSPRGGTFQEEDPVTRLLLFRGIDVIPGTSGGAIVTTDAIVAMVLRTAGGGRSVGLPAQRILQLLPRFVDQSQPLLGATAVPPASPQTQPSPGQQAPAAATFSSARNLNAPQPATPSVPRAGEVFRDCAECPEMVVIPAGSFLMGSPANEHLRVGSEGPQRRVSVPSLAVGRFEIARREFADFQRATGRNADGGCTVRTATDWELRSGRSWRDAGYAQTDEHPVACVSWEDAQAYVRWLSAQTGRSYRLLTEAEWEYAARAGTTTPYSFGGNADDLCRFGNGSDMATRRAQPEWATVNCDDGYVATAPVGRFAANAFGLHDMHGNVAEWVQDCFHASYDGAPSDGRAVDPATCDRRVLRGGSWSSPPTSLRSADRRAGAPSDRVNVIGFRVARSLF